MAAGTLLQAGCDSQDPGEGSGTMRVLLTDAPFPFDQAAGANVTIRRIELLTEAEHAFVLMDSVVAVNLLTLRDGVTKEMAEVSIPAGRYRQLRVILGEEASVVMRDGTVFPLKTPSASQSGLKVLLPAFEIDEADEVVSVTLDFDVSESFVVQGGGNEAAGIRGFLFRPVLKPVAFTVNGAAVSLEGTGG